MTAVPGPGAVPEGVVLGDCREVLAGLPDGCIDLVYIDPPFGTGQVRRLGSIRTGVGTRERVGFGGRRYPFEVVSDYRYRDDMSLSEYLEFLRQCLSEVHRVLRPTGSLYLHLDFHAAHYARVLLDELFGPERFLNEVIWAYDYGGRAQGPLAPQARQHPVVLEDPPAGPSTLATSTASLTWHRGWWGRTRRPGGSSHRHLVAHHRADQQCRADRLPHPEAAQAA